jgi:hypothetical protein
MHIRICRRMRVSYLELMATPAWVVEDHLRDMVAESTARRIKDGWDKK